MTHRSFYEKVIKRILDVLISSVGMLLFSWLYAIVALLVRFFLGKPVIFSQERPGRNDPKTGKEKPFRLYKFRSMTDAQKAETRADSTALLQGVIADAERFDLIVLDEVVSAYRHGMLDREALLAFLDAEGSAARSC